MKCKNCGAEMSRHYNGRCPSPLGGGFWLDTTFAPIQPEQSNFESLTEIEKLSKMVDELLLKISELEKRIVHLENELAAREYREELMESIRLWNIDKT